jgi:hypothetical protein
MANSTPCWDDHYGQLGFCASAQYCHALKKIAGIDAIRCPVSSPFSMIEANLFKGQSCCTGRSGPRLDDCESYFGASCGEYGGYGQIYSKCCLNSDDDTTAVLYCATGGISLTWQQCQSGFLCVERLGITSGKKRELAPYAQCEKTDD